MAARAGVSLGTASKVLNRRGALRPETRAKVLSAAEELGFVPNALARSLLSGRSFTVGVIASDVVGRFSIPVMLGVEDTLGAGRIAVLFCDGRGDPIREEHYLRSLLSGGWTGSSWPAARPTRGRPLVEASPCRLCTHGPLPPTRWTPQWSRTTKPERMPPCDTCWGRGTERVGHVTGPQQFRSVELRAAGAMRALADDGLELAPPGVLYGDWSEAWGRQAAAILARSCPDVDAVFCGNDEIARGVAEGMRDLGRRIPEDVALVGFDNWEIMSAHARVPLSTVDMDLHEVGRTAAQRLLEAIDGHTSHGVEFLPCRLLPRESTDLTAASSR